MDSDLKYPSNALNKDFVKQLDSSTIFLPTGIFSNRKLSFLESIVKYLKENLGYTNHEIALLINRDERNVWTLYNRAQKKDPHSRIKIKDNSLGIPLVVVCDRNLSILEVVVVYLKDKLNLRNAVIAKLLDRSSKTVWTCYNRAKKKLSELGEPAKKSNAGTGVKNGA